MSHLKYLVLLTVTAAACSSGGAPAAPAAPPAPTPWTGDTLLAPILNAGVMGLPQMAKADTLASVHADFDKRLAAVAEDSTAPPLVRSNAIMLLSDRRVQNIDPFLAAMRATDDRVRASAVVGMRPFLNMWGTARTLLLDALKDPSALVQTKALETLGDGEPELLREYAARAQDASLRKIASDLVLAAEERGAALVAPDSSGRLERVSGSGYTIRFVPTSNWPQWNAAAGELHVGKGKTLTRISDKVEAVGNVIPAFITAEGDKLVYEADRQIHLYDLKTNAHRVIGAGIAPRLMPFSQSLIYLRGKDPMLTPQGSTLKYDVIRVELADLKETVVGQLTANAQHNRRGHYSPVRWMRVRESDGQFFLMGESIDPFRLPSPFGG